MNTHASHNGTTEAEMEFEAAHYSNPELEDEWETPMGSHYSNPYTNPELEDEWEMPEGSYYSNPYSNPEMEDEWEMPEGSHYSNPYTNPELEDEWETPEGNHYSNPYSNPELEDEWEMPEGSPYSNPELEDEWETPEGSHYSNPYSNPEMEDELDRIIPFIKNTVTKILPGAAQLGKSLLNRLSSNRRFQQIAPLLQQLGRFFTQGEREASAHEAHLFGASEFETEVAGHSAAYQAALTEVMAAEASHTESESEAQALLGATLPTSIRVMGGDARQLTPTLVKANAHLVQTLHRQGRLGRQALRVIPAVQRRTLATIGAMQSAGQPVSPALAAQIMAGQTARVLTNPRIARQVLARNMMIRNRTVAPAGQTSNM